MSMHLLASIDTTIPRDVRKLVRIAVYNKLSPESFHKVFLLNQIRNVFNAVRKRINELPPIERRLINPIYRCRPYGGYFSLVNRKTKKVTKLPFTCKHRLCPYCHIRIKVIPAFEYITTHEAQYIQQQQIIMELPESLADARQQILAWRRSLFQSLDTNTVGIVTMRLEWFPEVLRWILRTHVIQLSNDRKTYSPIQIPDSAVTNNSLWVYNQKNIIHVLGLSVGYDDLFIKTDHHTQLTQYTSLLFKIPTVTMLNNNQCMKINTVNTSTDSTQLLCKR